MPRVYDVARSEDGGHWVLMAVSGARLVEALARPGDGRCLRCGKPIELTAANLYRLEGLWRYPQTRHRRDEPLA